MTREEALHIARALASTRPQGLEGTITEPRLDPASDLWAQTCIAVSLAIKHLCEEPQEGFMDAIWQERPSGNFWWTEPLES